MIMTTEKVKYIRAKYPAGTRVECICMQDPWSPIKRHTKGTVQFVDDAGQIHMIWDDGRTIPLIYGEDSFKVIE